MIVECGQCYTKFQIEDDKIPLRGIKVRCSKCKHTFMVKKEGMPEDTFSARTLTVPTKPPAPPSILGSEAGGKKAASKPPSLPLPPPLPRKSKAPHPPAASVKSEPVSGEAVGRPTQDLFQDLGDPFAGLPRSPTDGKVSERPSIQDDPFVSVEPPVSASDDPFSSIDTSSAADSSHGGMAGELVGNDPFAQMGGSGEEVDALEPSGLELDKDNRPAGPAPPPTHPTTNAIDRAKAREELSQLTPVLKPPAPMKTEVAEAATSSTALWLYKFGFGIFALIVALLLFVAYRSGGRPDFTSWSTYVKAFVGESANEGADGDLKAVKTNNTTYANRFGHPLLVVWGEVENNGQEKKTAVVVTGMLVTKEGRVVGKLTAPAGVMFTPLEVFEMPDRRAVEAAYRSKLPATADIEVPLDGTVPFMLVFYDHPLEMDGLRFQVQPSVSRDPLRGLPAAPEAMPLKDTPEESEKESEAAPASLPPTSKLPEPAPVDDTVTKEGTFVRFKPAVESPSPLAAP